MDFVDSIFLAVALAMDCLAVSAASGVAMGGLRGNGAVVTRMATAFGLMQALMPLVTVALGQVVADEVGRYEHWVALVVLSALGGKMVWEDVSGKEETETVKDAGMGWGRILLLSVATSIDAMATGVLFVNMDVWNVAWRLGLIGLVSSAFTVSGFWAGGKAGRRLPHVDAVGGVILILIGVKIFMFHYV